MRSRILSDCAMAGADAVSSGPTVCKMNPRGVGICAPCHSPSLRFNVADVPLYFERLCYGLGLAGVFWVTLPQTLAATEYPNDSASSGPMPACKHGTDGTSALTEVTCQRPFCSRPPTGSEDPKLGQRIQRPHVRRNCATERLSICTSENPVTHLPSKPWARVPTATEGLNLTRISTTPMSQRLASLWQKYP